MSQFFVKTRWINVKQCCIFTNFLSQIYLRFCRQKKVKTLHFDEFFQLNIFGSKIQVNLTRNWKELADASLAILRLNRRSNNTLTARGSLNSDASFPSQFKYWEIDRRTRVEFSLLRTWTTWRPSCILAAMEW